MANENENDRITRDDILSLDMAERCGYYSTRGYGTWDFRPKQSKNAVEQHLLFYNTLVEYVKTHGIKLIIAEDCCVSTHFISVRKLAEFRGVLFLVCAQLGLPEPKFINVSTVKKWATGDGKADKKKMMAYCKQRWGITPTDDNMADACHIYKYYVRIYRL